MVREYAEPFVVKNYLAMEDAYGYEEKIQVFEGDQVGVFGFGFKEFDAGRVVGITEHGFYLQADKGRKKFIRLDAIRKIKKVEK